MSTGFNRCTFLGNIGQDAELRVTPNGQAACKFSIACNETYLDRNNAKQERTEWVRCILWGKRAEGLAKYLEKGMRVMVEGRMQTSSYEKDGEKRYSTEIVVNEIVLCGGKSDGDRREQAPRQQAKPHSSPDQFDAPGDGGDDIPF